MYQRHHVDCYLVELLQLYRVVPFGSNMDGILADSFASVRYSQESRLPGNVFKNEALELLGCD
jgi:hypothetical protein